MEYMQALMMDDVLEDLTDLMMDGLWAYLMDY
jgi:hypothetical protein